MTHQLRILSSLCLLLPLHAAEFAVAPPPQGDDAGNGRDRPFATLGKALERAGSGDTVWLLRGGTFRETPGSFPDGVAIKAGGDAAKPHPLITPARQVVGWKPWESNPKVLVTTVDRPVLDLYVDGRFMVLARYPDDGKGWMRTAGGTSADSIASPDRAKAPKAAANRWTGGQARWRRWSWWWETRPITGDDGAGRLQLGADGRFQDPFTGEGSGFYVDNLLCELDAPGEWFWDKADKRLYLMPPEGADPKTMLVEAVADAEGWKAQSVTLEGVGFARFAGTALQLGRRSTVKDCLFQDCSTNAVGGSFDAGGTLISGCTFRDVRNVAIAWMEKPDGPGGTIFEGNRLERIGMRFGYGGSGSWHAAGVIIHNGKAVAMRRNTVIDTGYAGVILGSPGHSIERNIFVRCMGSLNDGAAIYANTSKLTIHENIILDTVGNLDTSQLWYPLGHGIWMEFLSQFREHSIVGNTVYGSNGHGLFLTNNFNCEVRDNVFAGNRLGQLHLSTHGGGTGAQNHTIAGNLLVAQSPLRRIPRHEQIPANWSGNDYPRGIDTETGVNFGSMSGTVFVLSPGTAAAAAKDRRWDEPGSWKAELPWADQQPRGGRMASLLLINDTDAEQTMTPPGSGWLTIDGKPAGNGVAIAPFRSAVVVRDGREDGLPPYLCASGTDWRAEPRAPDTAVAVKSKAKGRSTAAKAPADAPAPAAAAAPIVAQPSAEAWKLWIGRLRLQVAERLARKQRPGFHYSAMHQDVTIEALDGDTATLVTPGAGTITADLFGKLKAVDGYALARDLCRSGDPTTHALAAFFGRCLGDPGAEQHLQRAGELGAEVSAAFPAR